MKNILFQRSLGFVALCCATLLVLSACASKKDKEKYHGEIKIVVDKAERNAAFLEKMMSPDTSASDPKAIEASLIAFVEGIDKYDADLKAAKAELAKIATPKFDDNNLKSSVDKWFDAQIQGMSDMRGSFQEAIKVVKLAAEVTAETEAGTITEEKVAQLQQQSEKMNFEKKFRDIAVAIHNAENEVRTNEDKFILQYGLTTTKFEDGAK